MIKLIDVVESVCPVCLRRVAANLIGEGETVSMVKECEEHGPFSTVIWRGPPAFESWLRPKIGYQGGRRDTSTDKGCPYDCGLCPEHAQRTCTALVEVTGRCNLQCPVCFAGSGNTAGSDEDIGQISDRFAAIFASTGGCNLQISGGEPTMREDLPDIINAAGKAGFTFIQLNTNGLRLAADLNLAEKYRDAGLSSVFLQFDGISDQPYRVLRGRPLWSEKQRALENLARVGLGVVLVATVARDVNEDMLWDIVRFGIEQQPTVRGVHFQPLSFFGRYPTGFTIDHVTLPEIMTDLQKQSAGILQAADFNPPGCEHALCSFSAKYLVNADGKPMRLGQGNSCNCQPTLAEEGARQSIDATARQWGPVTLPSAAVNHQPDDLDDFLARARTHTFSISAMAFQDVWNLNLERLRGCCIHVAPSGGGLVPFCAYNLTAMDGCSLYRRG